MYLSIAKLEHAVARRINYSAPVEAAHAAIAAFLTIGIALSAFAMHLNLASASSILLLVTIVVSMRWGVIAGTAVSLTAVGCLDFFFTSPFFRFSVHDQANLIALITFQVTALLVSRLSWKERRHAEEQEYQRQGISKLYQLSNAILLVDNRSFDLEQLAALVREFFSVSVVDLWTPGEGRPVSEKAEELRNQDSAYSVYESGKGGDSIEGGWSSRVLQMGTSAIGGMVLQGWEVDPALADAAGSLIAIAIERARSAQKENRAEATRNTEQLRTAVLDALAHSFKTPLTAIQTASSGLLAIGQLGETQTELVEIIDQEVMMLASLTTRLLQTAALDAKEVRVRASEVPLLPFLVTLVNDQEPDIRRRIHIAEHAAVHAIHGDPQLLRLALAQVIDNAAKYSLVGTRIEIQLTQSESSTVITVSNEGAPIRTEELSRIFERYYRGAQAGRGPTGTGLGLSIVKKIAEAHGGDASASWHNDRVNISLRLPRGKGR